MVDSIFKKIVSYLLILSIFVTGPALVDRPFSVFWFFPLYVLFILYGTVAYRRTNIKIMLALFALIVYSLATFRSDVGLVIKQIVNIAVAVLVFYNFIVHEKYDLHEIFRKYSNVAKAVLVVGLLQVMLFILGGREIYLSLFPYLRDTNISERFQSLSDEPSFIALTFIPVVFVSLHNLFYRTHYFFGRTWSVLFVLGYLLTLSSAAFLALVLVSIVLYFKKMTVAKGILGALFLVVVCGLAVASYNKVDYIKVRVDDTFFALGKEFQDPTVYREVNLSTYAFFSNLQVTKQTISEYPFFGRGLGTHEVSYDLYLPPEMQEYSKLNRKDANSLALRLLSETGVIGLMFFLLFVLSFRIRRRRGDSSADDILWIMNTAIVVMFVIILLRNGNYTSSGKMLFVLLYYYSYRYYRKKPESDSSQSDAVPIAGP